MINPATEEELGSVELLDADAVDDAVEAARAAQRVWAAGAPAERAAGLRAFAAVVDAHADELAALEVANSGHPIASAEWEARHVRDVLLYYAASPERLAGKQIPVAGGLDITFDEPIGVVGVITPWNFPMTIASWGFAPALAAGNAVLVKPAEWTPLTTIRLAELGHDAGLPDDCCRRCPARVRWWASASSPTPTSARSCSPAPPLRRHGVMAGAAAQVKRVTLELGGKSANIVFDDCDLEKAAATAPYGVFDNAGQDCCARSRILVQRNVYSTGSWRLLEPAVKGVVVGDPSSTGHRDGAAGVARTGRRWRPMCPMTPPSRSVATPDGAGLLVPAHRADPAALRPHRHRGDLRSGGDRAAFRRRGRRDRPRQRHAPTGCRDRSGPTTCRGRCGCRAPWNPATLSVNSHSSVRYNTPFGGFKQSGLGRELGPDAPLSFTETKNVFFAIESLMDLTQRLAGKVAVITGGAGGIGLATGRRMRAEGATIVVGDIDPTAGRAAADELDGLFVPVDVSRRSRRQRPSSTAAARRTARSTSRSTMPASRRQTTT